MKFNVCVDTECRGVIPIVCVTSPKDMPKKKSYDVIRKAILRQTLHNNDIDDLFCRYLHPRKSTIRKLYRQSVIPSLLGQGFKLAIGRPCGYLAF